MEIESMTFRESKNGNFSDRSGCNTGQEECSFVMTDFRLQHGIYLFSLVTLNNGLLSFFWKAQRYFLHSRNISRRVSLTLKITIWSNFWRRMKVWIGGWGPCGEVSCSTPSGIGRRLGIDGKGGWGVLVPCTLGGLGPHCWWRPLGVASSVSNACFLFIR